MHDFLNCLPILIIMIFIKTSYDYFWIFNIWVFAFKITRNPIKVTLGQLNKTTLNSLC